MTQHPSVISYLMWAYCQTMWGCSLASKAIKILPLIQNNWGPLLWLIPASTQSVPILAPWPERCFWQTPFRLILLQHDAVCPHAASEKLSGGNSASWPGWEARQLFMRIYFTAGISVLNQNKWPSKLRKSPSPHDCMDLFSSYKDSGIFWGCFFKLLKWPRLFLFVVKGGAGIWLTSSDNVTRKMCDGN